MLTPGETGNDVGGPDEVTNDTNPDTNPVVDGEKNSDTSGEPQGATDSPIVFKTDLFGGGEYDLRSLDPEQASVLKEQLEKTAKGYKALQAQVDKLKIGSVKKDQDDVIPESLHEESHRGPTPQLRVDADGMPLLSPELQRQMEDRNLEFDRQFDKNPLMALFQYVGPMIEERVKKIEATLNSVQRNIEAPSQIKEFVQSQLEEQPDLRQFENEITSRLMQNWGQYGTYEDAKGDISRCVLEMKYKALLTEKEQLEEKVSQFNSGNISDTPGGPPKPNAPESPNPPWKEKSSIEILTGG